MRGVKLNHTDKLVKDFSNVVEGSAEPSLFI